MNLIELHNRDVKTLQSEVKRLHETRLSLGNLPPVALDYRTRSSYTVRTKSYKEGSHHLDFSRFNRVLEIDPATRVAKVEPRVTMEELVRATLAFGLIPQVVLEFKNITVGGAISGSAAESSSFRFGCFHETCVAFEIVTADGSLIRASPDENVDLYYGFPGSYGSLGVLVSAEIRLIPAKKYVRLHYYIQHDSKKVLEEMMASVKSKNNPPDFIDGLIFSPDLAVRIEGFLTDEKPHVNLTEFSMKRMDAKFYWQHVKHLAEGSSSGSYKELMSLEEYLFRYDLSAYWVGAYLFHTRLLASLFFQGVFQRKTSKSRLNASAIQLYHEIYEPNAFFRTLLRPIMSANVLCQLMHHAESWVQNRFIVQDFCLPESSSMPFLESVFKEVGLFPVWLLPIKGSRTPQIFSPSQLQEGQGDGYFINVGLYGLPAFPDPVEGMIQNLEQKVQNLGGRKVLYSTSYYTQEQFWSIYSREAYEALRKKTAAKGFWHDIVDKVLSR